MQNEQTPKDLTQVKEEEQDVLLDHAGGHKHDRADEMSQEVSGSQAGQDLVKPMIETGSVGEIADHVTQMDTDQQASDYTLVVADDRDDIEEDFDEEGMSGTENAADEKDVDIINTGRTYAGFFARLTAYIIDHVFLLIPVGIVRIILIVITAANPEHVLNRNIFFRFSPADMILYAVSALYFILLTYITGRTIGKRIMRLKVVSAEEERKPSFFEILFRETFGRFLSAVILCIGYLMIIIGDQKEALHDYLADTRVIYR